jgi:hypothetical protein
MSQGRESKNLLSTRTLNQRIKHIKHFLEAKEVSRLLWSLSLVFLQESVARPRPLTTRHLEFIEELHKIVENGVNPSEVDRKKLDNIHSSTRSWWKRMGQR